MTLPVDFAALEAQQAAAFRNASTEDLIEQFRDGSGRALGELLRRGMLPEVLPRPSVLR